MSMKVFIGIPNYRDSVSGKFLDCFVRLFVYLARKSGPGDLQYMRIGLAFVDRARNDIWAAARASTADALLFLDDDMTYTPDTFERLWATPGDVVSALAFARREPPTRPVIYRSIGDGQYTSIVSYPRDAILEVDAIGLGFTLVRRPVLDALVDPFTRDSARGEDFLFCERAKAAGFSIVVNTAAKAGHLYTYPFEINESNAGGSMDDLYRALDPAAGPVPNPFPRPE